MKVRTISPSPLGRLSGNYRIKNNGQKGAILDNPAAGLLELYPAGYTQNSQRDRQNRQKTFQQMYSIAAALDNHKKHMPFGRSSYSIEIVHDAKNKYDKNALLVVLRADKDSVLYPMNGMDLGFIPKEVNTEIVKHLSSFTGGFILKVADKIYKKYYHAKVVLTYGEIIDTEKKKLNRFSDILEEM